MEQASLGSLTLMKGLQVLKIVAAADQPPRFMDLLRLTGLPKPTLHRMLSTLMESGMLRLNAADQTYRLGAQLITMSQRVWRDYDLPSVAKVEMARLQALTGESVALGMLSGAEVVYIDQILGSHQIGMQVQLGRHDPMHCTAIGKVILAFTGTEARAPILAGLDFEKRTSHTITDREAFERELTMIRARGYAIDDEEYSEGSRSVAAPVLDHTGRAIAAVGLAGPAFRLNLDNLHALGPDLIETTRRASLSAGGAPLPVAPCARPAQAPPAGLRCVLEAKALLGEGPLWSPEQGRLFWVDLYAPALHMFDPATGGNVTWPQREISSVVARAEGSELLLARHSAPALFDPGSGLVTGTMPDPKFDGVTSRFNDARVDARGRLWAGYMAFRPEPGKSVLFRIEKGRPAAVMETGLTLPNGIGWTRDNKRMFLVETQGLVIHAYDFDLDSGEIANRRPHVALADRKEGAPDGIVIDDEDCMWVAMWDGWTIRRYDPDGRLMQTIAVPVPRPTSFAFGGPDLRTLFVTSARIRLSPEVLKDAPLSGSIFAIDLPVGGQPTPRFGSGSLA